MNKFHLSIRGIAAFLLGVVFLVSGLLKLNDPVGTGLIVTEYFKLAHIGVSLGFAKALGVALSLTESCLGAALVCGVYKMIVAILTWILLGVFTVITFLLLLLNPEMDCGCFGEAIHLTHLQSFLKNIVLLVLAVLSFVPTRGFAEASKRKKIAFWCILASFLIAAYYNLTHNPTLDFTAFAPGNELYSSDDEYKVDESQIIAPVYKRGSQTAVFRDGYTPDTSWTYVGLDTLKRNSMKLEENAPVLSFRDSREEYQDRLATRGDVGIVSVYDSSKMSAEDWRNVSSAVENLFAAGATPIILSTDRNVPEYLSEHSYVSDYKSLITLNRSNGGLTLLDNGLIVKKYELSRYPSEEETERIVSSDGIEQAISTISSSRLKAHGFILYLIVAIIFL